MGPIVVMTLDLDALRAGLVALVASPGEIPPEQVPGLVADLARAQTALLAAACRPSTVVHRVGRAPERGPHARGEEAAETIGVTPRWVYRNAKMLPFTRPISRRIVRFSRCGIQRWLASRRT
jgi:predicted DNA-binding transcriptional regulator AlpA